MVDLYAVHPFGAHVRVVQVVLEREPVLVFLRPAAGRVSLLAAHRRERADGNPERERREHNAPGHENTGGAGSRERSTKIENA